MRPRTSLFILVALCTISCSKDLSEFREYAYGTQWLLTAKNGQTVAGREREIYHFLDYKTFGLQLPTTTEDGAMADSYIEEGGNYTIYCYNWQLYTYINGIILYQEWEIEDFSKDYLRVKVLDRTFGEDSASNGEVLEFRRLDKLLPTKDSLCAAPWLINKIGGQDISGVSVTFQKNGFYTLSTLEGEQWSNLPVVNATFIIYQNFLRLGASANPYWGKENENLLSAWDVTFYFEDGTHFMKWESLDNNSTVLMSHK